MAVDFRAGMHRRVVVDRVVKADNSIARDGVAAGSRRCGVSDVDTSAAAAERRFDVPGI